MVSERNENREVGFRLFVDDCTYPSSQRKLLLLLPLFVLFTFWKVTKLNKKIKKNIPNNFFFLSCTKSNHFVFVSFGTLSVAMQVPIYTLY